MSEIHFNKFMHLVRYTLALAALSFAALPYAQAVGVPGQGTWERTLQGRDLDGNASTFEAFYDTDLDITWLADTNFAKTSGFSDTGRMSWSTAKAWADNLVVGAYSDWRLPTIVNSSSSGCFFAYVGTNCGFNVNTNTSELAHMFYVTLGNKASTTHMALLSLVEV